MALPKIQHPTFNDAIPSTNQKIKLRPFTVKEEKILLMAQQSGENADIIDAIKQVLNNCIVSPGNVKVEQFTTFDLEYLFIKLRARSIGETLELTHIEKDQDGNEVRYRGQVNLDEVKVKFFDDHKKVISLTGDIGITLQWPSIDDMIAIEQQTDDDESTALIRAIKNVYEGDNVYTRGDDFDDKELLEFLEQLGLPSAEEIAKFFKTIPTIEHTVTFVSEKDNKVTKDVVLSGIKDFFTLR